MLFLMHFIQDVTFDPQRIFAPETQHSR